MNKKKVVVGMSGGVDSSVSALLLKEEGYDVIGISLKLLPNDVDERSCCSLASIEDARRVAEIINIPFYVLNLQEKFKHTVIKNFIEEYTNGKTPNPCIKCNEIIKFDYLLKFAEKLNCSFLATGHYARIDDMCNLLKGIDTQKDQSYFLYILTKEKLKNILFPVGNLTKFKVREIAKRYKLPVYAKKESTDICFIKEHNYAKFIIENSSYKPQSGDILNKSGEIIGVHNGIIFYTIGQRKKIGIHSKKPLFVISIDSKKNSIIVGEEKDTYSDGLIAKDINFIMDIENRKNIKAKIRYKSKEIFCEIYKHQDNRIKVKFKEPVRAITPGQSIVFYDGDIVLGGGIIQESL